jgi:hypothetical protein
MGERRRGRLDNRQCVCAPPETQSFCFRSGSQSKVVIAEAQVTIRERPAGDHQDAPPEPRLRPPHVWMAPDLQEFFRVMNSGRLQSCVRPFSAVFT